MTDIAEKFGISQPTVSRRIESGINSLRDKLKSRGVIVQAALLAGLLMENSVRAAPASIMKELGKIAIAGGKITIGTEIAAGIAVKTKIMAGILLVLFGAGLTVVFSFIANGENKPESIWELVTQPQKKQPASDPNKTAETKTEKKIANIKVDEVLAKYTQALDPIQSFIASTESNILISNDVPSWGLRLNEAKSFDRGEYRTDGKGKASGTSIRWGDIGMNDPNVPENKAYYTRNVAGDDFVYSHGKRLNQTEYNGREYHGTLTYQTPDVSGFKSSRDAFGSFTKNGILSYFHGYFDSKARLDSILKNEAKHISLRPKPEIINGSLCFVVEAETKYGDFTVWFDSEHGFHPAKMKIKMGIGDDIGDPGSPHIITKEEGIERDYTLDNVRFEKIDDFWMPMEADYKRIVILGNENGFSNTQSHFKITKITLNPDHEVLNSFGNPIKNHDLDQELINGTIVFIHGLKCVWQDGKVVDSIGKEVNIEYQGPKVVIGQALPDLTEFNFKIDPQLIQNRMLLVCFFDMNQRPSRNTILSLNKQANSLLEKGLYMVFIHAGAVEEKTFTSWLKRNEIKPPAGISRDGLPGIGYSWGVKSLPWLILTDKNHVVTDEGFSFTDLDEKIKN